MYPVSLNIYHILPHRITPNYTLSDFISYPWQKTNFNDDFKFSTHVPKNVIRYCHILSGLITPGHTLSPIFDRKAMSVTTLNSVPRLLKMLSNLASSYHVLSPYHCLSPIFYRKLISITTLNLVSSLLKVLSNLATSYLVFLRLITL